MPKKMPKKGTLRIEEKVPRCILGLDVSTTATGAAVLLIEDGHITRIHAETIETPTKRVSGARRFMEIRDRVVELLARYNIDDVGMEYYGVDNTRSSSISIVWLHGVLHLALASRGLNALYVPVPTLKKWMTGRGNKVEKPEMVSGINNLYGQRFTPEQHNAAEAFGVACLVAERSQHRQSLPSVRGGPFSEYELTAMAKWERAF